MTENEPKRKRKTRIGRPPKHAGYSIVYKNDIVAEHPELRQYLQACRDGLIDDLGGNEDELTQGQRILVDRILSKLSMVRLLEIYLAKHGVLRQDRLQEKVLECEPIVQVWQAGNNAIRADLQLLGIAPRVIEKREPDLQAYIEIKDKEKGT